MREIANEGFRANHSLFQRVKEPTPDRRKKPFGFGAGGTGLSDAAQDAIQAVWSWDYMGAAEFEHGEVANALAYMYDNVGKMTPVEHNGFFFLVHSDHVKEACKLWDHVIANVNEMCHNPALHNPEVVGWLDLNNGFFVGRTAAMRDALGTLLSEYKE